MRKNIVLFVIIFTGIVMVWALYPFGAYSQDGGTVHIVTKGDTLWDLSGQYIGDSSRWPEIWERNRYLTNPNYIFPGLQVIIFPPPPVEEEFIYIVEDTVVQKTDEEVVVSPQAERSDVAQQMVPKRTLNLSKKEVYGSGELVLGKPGKVGVLVDTNDEKLVFSIMETVYLDLQKEYPVGTELGIYRVEGPVSVRGAGRKGYKKKYIGKVRIERRIGNKVIGTITELFEESMRVDHLMEEIPEAEEFSFRYLDDNLRGEVIVGSGDNPEFAEGDAIYIKGGAEKGFEVGDVLNIYVPLKTLQELTRTPVQVEMTGDADLVYVAKGVVIRVNRDFSTVYVFDSNISFYTSAIAVRGKI